MGDCGRSNFWHAMGFDLLLAERELPDAPLEITTEKPAVLGYQRVEIGDFMLPIPDGWKPTTIFTVLGGKEQATAFVKNSDEAKLQKAIIPDSDNGAAVIQDHAIFFSYATAEESRLYRKKLGASPTPFMSTTLINGRKALHLVDSERDNPNKFAGGTTERYVLFTDNQVLIAEANYSGIRAVGELKTVFEWIVNRVELKR